MLLKFTVENGLAWLKFDHGKANEMGRTALEEFQQLQKKIEASNIQVMVSYSEKITSKGTPIFVAGADVLERRGWTQEQVLNHVRFQRKVLAQWRKLPCFHISVVHGMTLGWGLEYLITADYRLATPTAKFGLPETGLGIVPGAGGSSELASIIGIPQTLRLGITGERIDAREAQRIGLIQELCEDLPTALHRAKALAQSVLNKSPTAVAAFKRTVIESWGKSEPERQLLEDRAYTTCVEHGDAEIGRQYFREIRNNIKAPWPKRNG